MLGAPVALLELAVLGGVATTTTGAATGAFKPVGDDIMDGPGPAVIALGVCMGVWVGVCV
jgi:hypothetical protein